MQKKKSCENVHILGWPPPSVVKIHNFFFSNESFPLAIFKRMLTLISYPCVVPVFFNEKLVLSLTCYPSTLPPWNLDHDLEALHLVSIKIDVFLEIPKIWLVKHWRHSPWQQISILHGFRNHLLGFLLTNTGSYWKAGNGTVTLNSL